ncbi:MAG TPA: DUF1501 domain-containing protein [Gemmataceae bacterium]|nr:DUF1501 domain-containing protein [Gemmataceae bacterium]
MPYTWQDYAQFVSRRRMLQVGSLGLLGISLPHLLHADEKRKRSTPAAQADACVLVFLDGGPSHLDMWDMKPAAPQEIRSPFKSIATSLPGVEFSEYLPRLARHMHRCALIRSAHHSVNNSHGAAVYTSLTGYDRGEKGGAASPTDYPAIGSVTRLCRPPQNGMVPFVSLPYITAEGRGGPPQPGFFGGFLGRAFDPLFVLRDPNAPDFSIPELAPQPGVDAGRMGTRHRLLDRVDSQAENGAALRDMSGFQARAFDLLTSAAAQQAFRLDREPAPVRDAYGRNIYGQSVLLARRLIEAGTRVVCISWAPDANATWDTHGNNFNSLKNTLLPQLDAAVSSLLADLNDRGRLKRTLVVVMGEFGRSPRINKAAGRDHWNYCYSLLLAGGGIKPGMVFGSSDKIGALPRLNPVTPADIIATIYHCLGIPADLELFDSLHRPYQLVPWGSPIRDILV